MIKRSLASLVLAASIGTFAVPAPALADGAASTRNIIGGAALVGGALLIINHNKKVHEKYAEDARNQAAAESAANNAQAAYQAEHSAYVHEAALVSEYKHETSLQHNEIVRLRHQLASARPPQAPQSQSYAPAAAPAAANGPQAVRVASVSYGWGSL
jgi:hypothetical protein